MFSVFPLVIFLVTTVKFESKFVTILSLKFSYQSQFYIFDISNETTTRTTKTYNRHYGQSE